MKVKTADMKKYSREYMRQYRKEHPEVGKAANKAWYARNRDAQIARNQARYLEKRDSHLQTKYGIGLAEYDAMHAAQGGRCAICAADKTGGRGGPSRFHVDHCHTTKRVRGLLCNSCNRMIGLGKDDPAILRAGADYVERHAQPVLTEPEKSS